MQQQLERLIPGYNRNAKPTPPANLQRVAARIYTIPIVFHVIHNGEPVGTGSNIADARIIEQLNRLNEDYAKLNADQTGVPQAFQAAHADVQIRFALAQRDINGNCITGIDRIDRSSKNWTAPPYTRTYIESTIKPGSSWNPDNYMNFWVLVPGGTTQDDGLLGYAQFPDNTAGLGGLNTLGGNRNTDGVVCRASAVGNGGAAAAPYNLGRTATHEVGHWLGLRHIWGDAACGTDYVTDTPTQNAENYGCPSFPHVTCSNGTNGDMFMNYMDYTDDACMFMFSSGQKDRMQAVMAAGTPRRSSLATSPALPAAVSVTASTSTPVVCAGSSIFLNGDAPTGYTYTWTGPNGFTSNQQNPSLSNVSTAASGTYIMTATPSSGCPVTDNVDVEVRALTATPSVSAGNGGLSCGVAPVLLTATPAGNQTSTFLNQNWNTGTTEAGWTYDNTSTSTQAGATWVTVTPPSTTGVSIDGTRYIAVDASGTNRNAQTRSSLYSPVFNATGVSTLTLTFKHIFVFATGDLGKVEISNNGGGSWTTLASYSANAGSASAPASVTLNLNAYAGQSNLKLRWNYSSNSGESWSVDNMLVTGTVANTYAWSLVSGDGMPATLSTSNTLQVAPSQNSVYQVTVTAPGLCASVGAQVTVTVPTATSWTGAAGDGAWANAANWTPCIPTRNSTATIPNGLATPYPVVSTAVEIGSIVQNGPLTISGGSLSLFGDHTGTATFLHTGGTYIVAGGGNQRLRGATYGALLINGGGTKTLQDNATATSTVTLTNGILSTGANLLTLGATSTLSENATSYVLGRVTASGAVASGSSSAFNGVGATIAAPGGSVSPGTVQVVRTTGSAINSTSLPGGRSISRSYDLTPSGPNTGLNLTLTLKYNTVDLGSMSENLLYLYRATSASSSFSRFPSTVNTTSHQVTASAVDHLSVWTLAASSNPLPVELSAFEAAAVGADARLTWTTASEKNNDHFEVQVSTNGTEFQSIGRVASQGNTARATNYSLVDAKIARYNKALLYYRLRQVDTDGTATLSPVRTLSVGGAEAGFTAQLVPNPSQLTAEAPQLYLAGPDAGAVSLTLRDAVGRVLSQRQVNVAGTSMLALPEAAKLAAGLYILEVQQGARRLNLKMVRE